MSEGVTIPSDKRFRKASGFTALAAVTAFASSCVRVETPIEGTVEAMRYEVEYTRTLYLETPWSKTKIYEEKDDMDYVLVIKECDKQNVCKDSDIYVSEEIFNSTIVGDHVKFDLATNPDVSRTD
jgi:hypothetical protein